LSHPGSEGQGFNDKQSIKPFHYILTDLSLSSSAPAPVTAKAYKDLKGNILVQLFFSTGLKGSQK
jgi:hypothetical protein